MKFYFWSVGIAIILSGTVCLAGTLKTGGAYEVLSDVIENAGSAPVSGGDFVVYQSVGQPAGTEIVSSTTYTIVNGFLGVVDEIPPTIEFTSPGASSDNGGDINIIGTAFDESGAEWTLCYGPGSEPAAWKELCCGDHNVSNASLMSWDASMLKGTYTLRVVATDNNGNTATGTVTFNIGNSATIEGAIPKFKWMLISMPVQPSPSDPVTLFGTAGEYKVFRRDPQAEPDPVLGQYRYPESLNAGDSFWIKSYYNDLPYSYTGTLTDTTQDYSIQLYEGWNQVGAPFDQDFPMAGLRVRHEGQVYDISTAASLGLISSTLYSYDHDTKSWVQNNTDSQMLVETGYDIRAYQDIELLFGPGAGQPDGLMRIVRPKYDYKLRISAAAGNSADLDNHIGAVSTADEQYDAEDAEEPPRSMDDKYTTLYFPRDSWSRNAGRYANDIRPTADEAGESETWTFNVETNETGEMVSLAWDNTALPTEGFSFTLINLDTGECINMAEQGSYSYAASGTDVSEAHFKIEVVKLDVEQTTVTFTLRPGWNLISVPLEPEVTNALEQLGDDLPLLNFYQYFENQFYPSDSADIQAGLGYWVYVSDNTEIDIVGVPVPTDQPIEVPLKQGWNLIGNPFNELLSWDDNIIIKIGDDMISLSAAISKNIIEPGIYKYNGTSYEKKAVGSTLEPWTGYFIKASQNCVIVLKI
ncbi:MAG TPA: hypothetical protein PLN69_08960 [bacterium]|nr:hypothetical protein [bacterium]